MYGGPANGGDSRLLGSGSVAVYSWNILLFLVGFRFVKHANSKNYILSYFEILETENKPPLHYSWLLFIISGLKIWRGRSGVGVSGAHRT